MKKRDVCVLLITLLAIVFISGCRSAARQPLIVPQGDNGGGGADPGVPLAINTNVDPAYTGVSYESKYVPPAGRTLLIVGQDKTHIPEYADAVNDIPGGWASYWAISTNTGITNDQTNCAVNVQNLKWIVDHYPDTVAQSAMWMSGEWDEIVCTNVTNGTYDGNIDTFIAYANATDIPIYLRIGYEFDLPSKQHEPELFKTVYKYIVDRMVAAGVTNVAYVWHSWAQQPYNGYALSSWYPGDDYVDWFAISYFDQVENGTTNYMDDVVDMALIHNKPVMIAESTPIGGIAPNTYETWNEWFVPMFSYAYEKNIKVISYINCDWEAIAQFQGWGWGDTRVQNNPYVEQQWLTEINKTLYLKQSSTLFDTLGY